MNGKRSGSLSVEATISFAVFIGVMFLLLNIVKLTLFMIILNNAAAETAKTIATLGYPITFLNEAQSGIEEKAEYLRGGNLSDAAGSGVQGGFGDILGASPERLQEMVQSGGASDYVKNKLMNAAVDIVSGAAYTLKGAAIKGLVGWFVKNALDNASLDFNPDALYMRMAKIPVTEAEYNAIYTDPVSLSKQGTLTAKPASKHNGADGDFNAEDVVICLEYPVVVIVPVFRGVKVTLRSVAVEHAWLHGVCDGPKRTEGIDLTEFLYGDDIQVYVAVGGHGERYHATDKCMALWKNSKQPISRSAAIKDGFTPCKICKPDDKKEG